MLINCLLKTRANRMIPRQSVRLTHDIQLIAMIFPKSRLTLVLISETGHGASFTPRVTNNPIVPPHSEFC